MSDLDRQRFGVSAHALPVGEVCPEAPWLARNGTPSELWREALRFGLIGKLKPSPPHLVTYGVYLRQLSDVVALHVDHAVNDAVEDSKLGIIPDFALTPAVVNTAPYGPIEGTLIADGYIEGTKVQRPPRGDFDMDVVGVVDHAWVSTPGNEGEGAIAVVLQHELVRNGKRHLDDLELAACGLAFAAERNVERMKLGRCYHSPTRPPVYDWSLVIEDAGMTQYWERIQRALMRPHVAAPGDHCERCPVRTLCAQWQYPILIDGTTTLKTLTNNVNAETYPKLKGLTSAMKHVLGIAEAKLRTYEREGRG